MYLRCKPPIYASLRVFVGVNLPIYASLCVSPVCTPLYASLCVSQVCPIMRESCWEWSLPGWVRREGILLGREPLGHARRGDTSHNHSGTMGAILPRVYTPLYYPGYTRHPTHRHTGTRRTTGGRALAALSRALAELSVRKRGLTVAPVTDTRFTVGCC